MGGAKGALIDSLKYANEREQFGRPISKYGAIRHKLAEHVQPICAELRRILISACRIAPAHLRTSVNRSMHLWLRPLRLRPI